MIQPVPEAKTAMVPSDDSVCFNMATGKAAAATHQTPVFIRVPFPSHFSCMSRSYYDHVTSHRPIWFLDVSTELSLVAGRVSSNQNFQNVDHGNGVNYEAIPSLGGIHAIVIHSYCILSTSVKTNRGISIAKMARAADICPEVPLTPRADTEIVLVALG